MLLSKYTIYLIMQGHFRSSDRAKFPIMTQFNTEQIREEAAFREEKWFTDGFGNAGGAI